MVKRIFRKLRKIFLPTEFDLEYRKWISAGGDETHRYKYPLTSQSLVWDVGGYEGEFAARVVEKFNCNVWIFEPVESFFKGIVSKFRGQEKIRAFNFGIGSEDQSLSINLDENASSTFTGKADSGRAVTIAIKSLPDFINRENPSFVDLMKINIEGGEYDLLSSLIASGFVSKVGNIQVQFHDFVPDAQGKYEKLSKALAKTHQLTWQYKFVWENWKLKAES